MTSTLDFGPDQWRRLFTPVGAAWIVCAAIGFGEAIRLEPGPILIMLAGWGAAGAAALAAGAVVERVWLAGWPRIGVALVRARQHRWVKQRSQALHAATEDSAAQHLRRAAAIGLARPVAATWMADRWAALDSRVLGAYGLDLASSWPRLCLVLPASVRAQLDCAAQSWHRSCAWAGWAGLYGLLATIWRPALVIAAILALLAWASGRSSIARYADLIESGYDLYGPRLARLMAVSPPQAGRLDVPRGRDLTALLRKGS